MYSGTAQCGHTGASNFVKLRLNMFWSINEVNNVIAFPYWMILCTQSG